MTPANDAPGVRCPTCEVDHPVADLLRVARRVHALEALSARCPGGDVFEFSVESGAIFLGYTYVAGAPHFCRMERVTLPGLRVESWNPLRLVLGAERFLIR